MGNWQWDGGMDVDVVLGGQTGVRGGAHVFCGFWQLNTTHSIECENDKM